MKIIVTEPEYWPADLVKPLEALGRIVAGRFTRPELLKQVRDADALLVRVETKVDLEMLNAAKRLKVIASMSTGLDHIDVEAAKRRGIRVVSRPGYATVSAAEYTVALMLSLARNIPWAADSFKEGRWERHRFIGTELAGKTIGVVGFGRIGRQVARYAQAFGMHVMFYDPYVAGEPLPGAEQAGSVDALLAKSDVITLHALLSKETERIIRKDNIDRMKKGVMIVNTSRGRVIDDSDLIHALKGGVIAGAALDVFSEEPLPKSHELLRYARRHQNLLLTPHMAGSTSESIETAARFIVKSVLKILKT